MLSAVNIDGLDKEEQREHLFNDVKYATIRLNKDLKQIFEQYKDGILKVDIRNMKKRFQEEYSEFGKPTYEFLQLSEFSLEYGALSQYLNLYGDQLKGSVEDLTNIRGCLEQLKDYGLEQEWTLLSLMEMTALYSSLDATIMPTRYWFDFRKYDFIQELMNEAQNNVEQFVSAKRRMEQSWKEEIYTDDAIVALDYYVERSSSGMKLFDLNYHKCKKKLKEMFQDEARVFQDSEILELHKQIYLRKRTEYWLSKNHNRILQFLGNGYQGVETDFVTLRSQYALIYKLSSDFTTKEQSASLANCFIEESSFQMLTSMIEILRESLESLEQRKIFDILPCEKEVIGYTKITMLEEVLRGFCQRIIHLHSDYGVICEYLLEPNQHETFFIEDLRKILFLLERAVQKQEWLKKHQTKIKELFRNEAVTNESDWNALREKIIDSDLKDSFLIYQSVDEKEDFKQYCGQLTTKDAVLLILSCECPIKEEIFYRKVTQLLGLPRMTPKLKQEVKELLEIKLNSNYLVRDQFIYDLQQKKLELRIPKEGERREIQLIAPEELRTGIVTLLTLLYEMTLDQIEKELAELLGYPRRTKKFNDFVEDAVKLLQRDGVIKRYSGGFRVEKAI